MKIEKKVMLADHHAEATKASMSRKNKPRNYLAANKLQLGILRVLQNKYNCSNLKRDQMPAGQQLVKNYSSVWF